MKIFYHLLTFTALTGVAMLPLYAANAAESSVYSTSEHRNDAGKPGAKANNHAYDAAGNGSTPRAADTSAKDIDTSTQHEAMATTDEKIGTRAIDSADQQVIEKGQKIHRKNELGSKQDPALRQNNVKEVK